MSAMLPDLPLQPKCLSSRTFLQALELGSATRAIALAGLPVVARTNPELTGHLAMAIHSLELRNAINEARIDSDINLPAIAFSDPAIEPGDLIRAVHLQELRGGVR